jgi:hypothetical protein
MHPVLEGRAMICAKNLQTIVNIRHFRDLSWEKVIVSDYEPLLEHAKKELIFWQENITQLNFRLFTEPVWHCLEEIFIEPPPDAQQRRRRGERGTGVTKGS